MDEALYRKFRQHRDLRDLLLNTYPYELVYVEPTDAYWGNGAGAIAGLKVFGKSLVRVHNKPIRSFVLTKSPNERNEKNRLRTLLFEEHFL